MGPLDVARVVVVLVLVVYLPGRALGSALGMRDVFASVWLGLATLSTAGTVLALAGLFSLGAIVVVALAVVAAGALLRRRHPPPAASTPDARVGAIACAASVMVIAWCWPPFETVIAASDSTMYVNSGIHLARTGRLDLPDTVVPLLSESVNRAVFPSVSLDGSGPFIRLPGGLLMRALRGGEWAAPAFFPLTSVWAGILAAAGGPAAAPLTASLFAALGAAAVVLFAGETLGAAVAACSALLLVANFALWWFARFPTSETIALCFVWGGLVFLGRALAESAPPSRDAADVASDGRRAASLAAGCCFGLAGLARTETFLFIGAAGAVWLVWTRRRPALLPLLGGLALIASVAGLTFVRLPTHHVAYLVNDAMLTLVRAAPALAAARGDPRLVAAVVGVLLLVVLAGAVGWRWRVGFFTGAARLLLPIALAATFLLYARIGGKLYPWRQLEWLAAYCTWPLLALAVAGAVVAWRRGGGAVRLALVLTVVVGVVFVVDPRVAPTHPWAIRRFLPVVIPGITIAAAAALGMVATSAWRPVRAAAWIATLVLATLEVRSAAAARAHPYFAGSAAAVRLLAEPIRANAIVVVDAKLADIQLQVPLWLAYDRETVMLHDDDARWKEALPAFVATGRPVYWIANRRALLARAPGLEFRTITETLDVSIPLPKTSAAGPPRGLVRRLVPLRVYEVVAAGPQTERTDHPRPR